MRPRISVAEAQFLLETMQSRKEEIQGLLERRKQLESMVYQLRKEAFVNPIVLIDEDRGFKDKKEELRQLEAQSHKLYLTLGCYESLIAKFQAIATGEKHKGRYKSSATSHFWRLRHLNEMEPKTA